jgi:CxxC motif-containing protein
MSQEMICIGCPMGCSLTVNDNAGALTVSGQECKIGEKYAKEEMTNPTRHITTSVRIYGGDMPMLSVKTESPIPKRRIMDCMQAIHQVTATAPAYIGDVVLENAAGTGINIVATRNVKAVGI